MENKRLKKILLLTSIGLAVIFYLYMGYMEDNFKIGGLGFILPIMLYLIYSLIDLRGFYINSEKKINVLIFLVIVVVAISAFLIMGFLLDGWFYCWMILLLIPVSAIYLFDNSRKLTPFTPFIAIVIFFTLGYFFDLYEFAWIAFLLVPIVAVIENT